VKQHSGRKLPTGEALRKQIWGRGREEADCTHRNQIREVVPRSKGCEECLAMGDRWVHLRVCLTCDSKNKHAMKHFQSTGHPLVKPMEEGEEWLWCFADEVMLPLNTG
jgi:hypothetical protein